MTFTLENDGLTAEEQSSNLDPKAGSTVIYPTSDGWVEVLESGESTPITSEPPPDYAIIWGDELQVLNGVALTHGIDAGQRYNGYSYQATAALNNELQAGVFLEEGTYDITQLGFVDINYGQVTIYVDGVSVGTLDWYNSTQSYNTLKTLSNISINGSGWHDVRFKVTGLNGSSTGHFVLYTFVEFRKA